MPQPPFDVADVDGAAASGLNERSMSCTVNTSGAFAAFIIIP
jgi:hypothetical protein